jgi:hypothetical protein
LHFITINCVAGCGDSGKRQDVVTKDLNTCKIGPESSLVAFDCDVLFDKDDSSDYELNAGDVVRLEFVNDIDFGTIVILFF